MIDANNLSQVLEILGLIKQGQVWTKHFIGLNCSMSVDFKNRRLIYPDDLLRRERNAGFDTTKLYSYEYTYMLIDYYDFPLLESFNEMNVIGVAQTFELIGYLYGTGVGSKNGVIILV